MIARYRALLARLADLYPDSLEFFRVRVLVYSASVSAVLVVTVLLLQILAEANVSGVGDAGLIVLALALTVGMLLLPVFLAAIGRSFAGRLLFVVGIFLFSVMGMASNGVFSFAVANLILAVALASVLF